MNHVVPAGTMIRCNRVNCEAVFPAPKDLMRTSFHGSAAARITTMVTCPVCERVDSPMVWAQDVMPEELTGTSYQQREKARAWMRDN